MHITKEEIATLPLLSYSGEIELINTKQEWLKAYEEIKQETLLGFDTETKPTYVKGPLNPPALMQLASEKKVYLVQFYKLRLQKSMCDLLSDKQILKVGVAIHDDMVFLQKLSKFKPAGHLDLAKLAHTKGYKESGLRTLCAALLGGRLSKTMQCSNWERIKLSSAQMQYAATDAWVSREIYLKLLTLEDKK